VRSETSVIPNTVSKCTYMIFLIKKRNKKCFNIGKKVMRFVTRYLLKLCNVLSYKVTKAKNELVMIEVSSFHRQVTFM